MIHLAIERYADCHADLEPMLGDTYAETLAPRTGLRLYFNKGERMALDGNGKFVVAVARDNGVAVGFCTFAIRRSWYDGRWYASEDAVFLKPEYRKGNTFRQLWAMAENECLERGVNEIQFIAPQSLAGKLKLWFRMGYRPSGVILTRVIGGGNEKTLESV